MLRPNNFLQLVAYLGFTTIKNRVVMGSMHTGLEDRFYNYPKLAAYLCCGISNKLFMVPPAGANHPWRFGEIPPVTIRPTPHAVHKHGSKILMQILHAGRYGYQPFVVSSTAIKSFMVPPAGANHPWRFGEIPPVTIRPTPPFARSSKLNSLFDIPQHRLVTHAVHKHGSKILMQILHAGRYSLTVRWNTTCHNQAHPTFCTLFKISCQFWVIVKTVLCNKLQKIIGTQHDKLRQFIKTITSRLYYH
jgi:2,4-dienoyl-CoA reductase-like NADH-dependent reductase (Old Yellow Enzyme family)